MIMKKSQYVKGILQIILLVGMTFSFSYFVHESSLGFDEIRLKENGENEWGLLVDVMAFAGKIIFGEEGFVSALDSVSTCIKSKKGELCQQFLTSECESKCDGACIPSSRDEVVECKLGTCVSSGGICNGGSPKGECEIGGGKWYDDKFENIQECKRGCCIQGDSVQFINEQVCASEAASSGFKKEFKPEVRGELQCLALAKTQGEGACVLLGDKSCKFTTASVCAGLKGEFHAEFLCSNPGLNTSCQKQKTTGCFDGRDEVYWIDSCGNRENIFSMNKDASWNKGKILAKSESCSLGSLENQFARQESCGSCNHFLGSTCGKPGEGDKKALFGNFVCKDLNCVDDGKERKNGESWCAYQGRIGVDENGESNRATDVPGSRNFRKVCANGEVRIEPCADFRNEICVEEQTEIPGGKFSSSACVLNRWQQCLDANQFGPDVKGKDPETLKKETEDACGKDSDCFIKEVDIDDGFKFNFCSPKYPEGFDLEERSEGAEKICSMASQQCTVIYVKKLFGGWECVANCDCEKAEFAEKMNDLCMSLGDCGVKTNLAGKVTKNYEVINAPVLSEEYIGGVAEYSKTVKGQRAEPANSKEFFGQYGIPGGLGDAEAPEYEVVGLGVLSGAIVGIAGITIASYLWATWGTGLTLQAGQAVGLELASSVEAVSGVLASVEAFGMQLAGAAAGAYAVSLVLKWTGVGAGLPPIIAYVLLASGAAIGLWATGTFGASTLNLVVCWDPVSCAIALVLLILLMGLFGIGDTKEVIVTFTCQPWQPPTGGKDCSKCGKDGLPCSRYQCRALGQTCDLINEGTGEELCINVNPHDASPPEISPLKEIYEGTNYRVVDESDGGFTVKGPDECIGAYEDAFIGIKLKEPGQCKFDVAHTEDYEKMSSSFGGSNLYKYNHTTPISIPNFESLGLPEYDPNAKVDYTFFVRCQDKSGNFNQNEYAVRLCVKPGEDKTPPRVNRVEPTGLTLGWNVTEHKAFIFTNEPAECKWDVVNKDYDEMVNNFACKTGLTQRDLYGWECNSVFPVVNGSENKFFVRCQDNPWMNKSEKRNKNSESYSLVFFRSLSPLNITSITPDNTPLILGVEPATVIMEVVTSGGADGSAKCEYNVGNKFVRFSDTFRKTHKQTFNSVLSGNKVFPVRCEDVAGNVAQATARFVVNIDKTAPIVTRVYDKSGLIVITDEDAKCAYSLESCDFSLIDETNGNITLMFGEGLVHNAEMKGSLAQYVKCKDKYGNYPGECSVIVRSG